MFLVNSEMKIFIIYLFYSFPGFTRLPSSNNVPPGSVPQKTKNISCTIYNIILYIEYKMATKHNNTNNQKGTLLNSTHMLAGTAMSLQVESPSPHAATTSNVAQVWLLRAHWSFQKS